MICNPFLWGQEEAKRVCSAGCWQSSFKLCKILFVVTSIVTKFNAWDSYIALGNSGCLLISWGKQDAMRMWSQYSKPPASNKHSKLVMISTWQSVSITENHKNFDPSHKLENRWFHLKIHVGIWTWGNELNTRANQGWSFQLYKFD